MQRFPLAPDRFSQHSAPMIVIAHRGFSGWEPENTLRSFRRALALGVDAIELDIRLTRDGVPVVIHDATLERTSNAKGRVNDFTRAELKMFRAGSSGESLPTLDEILALQNEFPHRFQFVVELKESGTPAPVVAALKKWRVLQRTLVISFLHELLTEMKQLEPALAIAPLWTKPPADAVAKAVSLNSVALDVNYQHTAQAMIEESHRRGMKFYVWTVNDEAAMREMMRLGVDGIATDFPDRLMALLKKVGRPLKS